MTHPADPPPASDAPPDPDPTGSAPATGTVRNRGGRPASFDEADFARVYDEALARTGREPSIKELQGALGGGSTPVISRHRDELRATRLLASGTPAPGTPGVGLLKALAAAQKALGADVADAARAQIDAATLEADTRIGAAERGAVRARDEVAAAALEREHARGQVVALNAELADAVAARRVADEALEAARDEARDLAERLARAEIEARVRTDETERLTTERDALDERLGRLGTTLETEREARETAERRTQVLEATLAETRESARLAAAVAAGTCRETIERAQHRAASLETRLIERDAALADARTETAVLAERLEGAQTARREAAERAAALETRGAALDDGAVLVRLAELERRVASATDDDA